MSNVSLVSICESVQTALVDIGNSIDSACAHAENAIRWLAEETPEYRAAVEKLKETIPGLKVER